MTTDALALLDLEGSERFVVAKGLRSAKEMRWDHVATCLQDDIAFIKHVAGGRSWPLKDIPALRASWAAQEGLVMDGDLSRLLWILQRFRRQVEVDLLQRVGVDLGTLWRDRRWRLLLNLIDHLPRATWTQQEMANDKEYAQMLADRELARKESLDDDDWAPPLVESTPEVVALSSLIDAVNALRATFIMANSAKGAAPPKIPPYPRPRTMADTLVARARRNKRWQAHDALAKRLLPGRGEESA